MKLVERRQKPRKIKLVYKVAVPVLVGVILGCSLLGWSLISWGANTTYKLMTQLAVTTGQLGAACLDERIGYDTVRIT